MRPKSEIMDGKFVSYIRKSPDNHLTTAQGLDSNSIGAQRAAIERFLDGGEWTILKEFVEYESGRKIKRPELRKALEFCKREFACLLVSNITRLARNAAFLTALLDSGVDFKCVDMPNADRFTLQIMACVAEKEAIDISNRTKAGMAIAKSKGVKIGNPSPAKAIKHSIESRQAKAKQFMEELKPVIEDIRKAFNDPTLKEYAECLNRRGYKTIWGGEWHPTSVSRLLNFLSKV
jgi:DNA invertase Pin-like site-specific DNA recombinase